MVELLALFALFLYFLSERRIRFWSVRTGAVSSDTAFRASILSAFFIVVLAVLLLCEPSVLHSGSIPFLFFALLGMNVGIVLFRQFEREKDFPRRQSEILSLLLMRLRAGDGLRGSLRTVIAELQSPARFRMMELERALEFHSPPDAIRCTKARRLFSELVRAQERPHLALQILDHYRRRVRQSEIFERRARQAVGQARGQSLLMTLIYMVLLMGVGIVFGWRENFTLISLSVLLFTAGALWIWCGLGRVRWTT